MCWVAVVESVDEELLVVGGVEIVLNVEDVLTIEDVWTLEEMCMESVEEDECNRVVDGPFDGIVVVIVEVVGI